VQGQNSKTNRGFGPTNPSRVFKGIKMLQAAINEIRNIETIDCDDIQALLNVIASKMAEAGFCDLDLNAIDEINGLITGEQK